MSMILLRLRVKTLVTSNNFWKSNLLSLVTNRGRAINAKLQTAT